MKEIALAFLDCNALPPLRVVSQTSMACKHSDCLLKLRGLQIQTCAPAQETDDFNSDDAAALEKND